MSIRESQRIGRVGAIVSGSEPKGIRSRIGTITRPIALSATEQRSMVEVVAGGTRNCSRWRHTVNDFWRMSATKYSIRFHDFFTVILARLQ